MLVEEKRFLSASIRSWPIILKNPSFEASNFKKLIRKIERRIILEPLESS